MGLEIAGLLLGGGILTTGVKGLWAIAKAIGSYEGRMATCVEQITKMMNDHENRLRALEGGDVKRR